MKQTSQIKVNLPEIVGKGYGLFWRSKNFYRVVKGGRGSKKSKTTALYYIVAILKYSWANLLVVRRFSNTNKQSTYTDLKWAANRLKYHTYLNSTRACQRLQSRQQAKRYYSEALMIR